MKRYDIEASCTVIPTNGEMVQSDDGDYVLYEAAVSEIASLRTQLTAAQEELAAAEQRGIVKGLEMAAEIADNEKYEYHSPSVEEDVCLDIYDAIRAKAEEVGR